MQTGAHSCLCRIRRASRTVMAQGRCCGRPAEPFPSSLACLLRDCWNLRVWPERLNTSGEGLREALAKEDGELSLRGGPLPGRHGPLFFRAVQDQEEQLEGRIVGGKMAPGPHGPPKFRVQR